jgi:hypothetical protein
MQSSVRSVERFDQKGIDEQLSSRTDIDDLRAIAGKHSHWCQNHEQLKESRFNSHNINHTGPHGNQDAAHDEQSMPPLQT